MSESYSCPPPPESEYRIRQGMSCIERLSQILTAYEALLSGQHRIIVWHNERRTEYQKGNAESLREYYNLLYRQCPDASGAGLPDLARGLQVRRGDPARGFHYFGRL